MWVARIIDAAVGIGGYNASGRGRKENDLEEGKNLKEANHTSSWKLKWLRD